ncbi:MAG: molybdopterin-dependent oxidoreductase [Acidimicrobiia bacterium]
MSRLVFRLNGEPVDVDATATTAVDLLRIDLGLTGTKLVCGTGSCGACVIQVDGVPVASCLLPIEDLDHASVTTIEGLAGGGAHPIQRAFAAHDGLQCGFCTPGFIMEAAAFHDAWRATRGTGRPTSDEVGRALAGHLCRCGAYPGIIAAVQAACEGRHDTGPITGPRVEAEEKVTGRARFTVDIAVPNMLHARIVRSPLAHAELVDVDASEAIAMPGVEGFVLLPLSDGRIRFVGQGFAAVAAVDESTARRAADAVVARFVELPPVVGIDAALAEDAPDLHGRGWTPPNSSEGPPLPNLRRGNLRGPVSVGSLHRFRARKAVRDSEDDLLFIDQRWEFPAQVHSAFEPHACVANWTSDGLTVHASTQNVSALRLSIAKRFGLDVELVSVIADHVGGGFGAKQGFNEETIVAVELSRATGRPVRLVFDRHEELEVAGYRPGARVAISLAGRADGSVAGFTSTSHADGGASAGQLIAVLQRLVYPGAPRSLLDYDVLTNAPPGRAMRAPGAPLALASIEGAVDEYAHRLGRDPIELRRSWDESEAVLGLYDWVESRPLWRDRPDSGRGRVRRAVGVAFGVWVYFYDPDTLVEVRSTDSGFTVTTGSQDMGNGTRTSLARAVSAALGVDIGMVAVEIGRSGLWGPGSAGSRTTTSVFPTASAVARSLALRLVDRVRDDLGMDGADLVDGGVSHAGEFIPWADLLPRLDPVTEVGGRPSDTRRPLTPFSIEGLRLGVGLTRSAHIADVSVDTKTGRIQPVSVESALAFGAVHVPELATSQVHGAVVQALGYALYEERLLDPVTGLNITTNLDQYRIPGIADMPGSVVEFLEGGFEHSASRSAGMAELATAAVPAAISNAVSRAVGHRFTRLPIRPEHVVEAMR